MKKTKLHFLVSGIWKFNALLGALYLAILYGGNFGVSSVLEYRNIVADPFDGTVYPIEYVPNWGKPGVWTVQTPYADIKSEDFIRIPKYDPKILAITEPTSSAAVLARYTYLTTYLGKYMDDTRTEYVGSHPAVDIRAPLGTPVRAMANGVVVIAKIDAGGDGKRITLRHDGVPFLGQRLEMYSSYLHLGDVSVVPGQKVKKGDVIGRVGMTGITTTPHLHFQIDRASAPSYPYWPYTFAEAKASGHDFFSAVNYGLNLSSAMANTYHPLMVVNENLSYSASSGEMVKNSSSNTVVASSNTNTSSAPSTVTSSQVSAPVPQEEKKQPNNALLSALVSAADDSFGTSSAPQKTVTPELPDATTQKPVTPTIQPVLASAPAEKEIVPVSASVVQKLPDVAPARSSEVDRLSALSEQIFYSAPEQAPVDSFRVIQIPGQPLGKVVLELKTLDYSGNATNAPLFGGIKVSLVFPNTQATKDMQVASSSFKNGVARVEFSYVGKAPQSVRAYGNNQLAATDLRGVLDAPTLVRASLQTNTTTPDIVSSKKFPFADVSRYSVYYSAVSQLFAKGIIAGTSATRFSPKRFLTRAEALIVIMRALNITPDFMSRTSVFADVSASHPVQPYLTKALEMGAFLTSQRQKFQPNASVTRAEFAALLFALGRTDSMKESTRKISDIPTTAWYANFVKMAIDYQVMKLASGRFRPTASFARWDAAVAIFNFLKKFPPKTSGL